MRTVTLPTEPPRRARQRLAAPLACAALLAGCASYQQPREAPEAPIPPRWSAPAPAAGPAMAVGALAGWWERFGDPLLAELVADALQINTEIAVAQARLRAARAQRDLAAAALSPTLFGSLGAQASRIEDQQSARQANATLDAGWEPDLWGGTRAGVDAAEADVRASRATLGSTQVQVAAEVVLAYLELRGTQARPISRARNRPCRSRGGAPRPDWSRSSTSSRHARPSSRRAPRCPCLRARSCAR
jgi:outer membrane protein TolC